MWRHRDETSGRIAFQGRPGAYSDLACRTAYPGLATLPCDTFEQAIAAVHDGQAALAMLPCENSLAGRVPDIHALLPGSGLSIVGEHFQRVEHCLLAPAGATLAGLKRVHSHAVALGQVRRMVRELGAAAGGAGRHRRAARSWWPSGAGRRRPRWPPRWRPRSTGWRCCAPTWRTPRTTPRASTWRRCTRAAGRRTTPGLMTTFVFRVRNVPAALFKALGGFATNGVNMTKLESYMVGGQFTATQFLCDVDGHPEQPALRMALEELSFFSREIRVLGVYRQAAFRGR